MSDHYHEERQYKVRAEFCPNSYERIKFLLYLLGKSNFLGICLVKKLNTNDTEGKISTEFVCTNFYFQLADIIKVPIVSLATEEATSSMQERCPVKFFFDKLIDDAEANKNIFLMQGIKEIQITFSQHIDYLIGSLFLDLTVNVFSNFEFYVGKIYEHIKDRSRDSKKKKLIKKINQYNSEENNNSRREEILLEIMDNCSSYVSGKEKIDFVMSKAKTNYAGDYAKDIEILNFLHQQRNTIHNSGTHNSSKSYALELDGTKIYLNAYSVSYAESYIAQIKIYDRICDVYTNIITALKINDVNTLLSNFHNRES